MLNQETFMCRYMEPLEHCFSSEFSLPLPPVDGLKKNGTFLIQGYLDNTYSTNTITKYESDSGYRFVEVYKNTEDRAQGIFIRLWGAMSLVKKGYPLLICDLAVSNLNPFTGKKEELTTRVALHLPQADAGIQSLFYGVVKTEAECAGIAYNLEKIPMLPDFWGPVWSCRFRGIDAERIVLLRNMACKAYKGFCSTTEERPDFDYRPAQEQIVFKNAETERHIFSRMGLSVSVEAQAAFFSTLVAGI